MKSKQKTYSILEVYKELKKHPYKIFYNKVKILSPKMYGEDMGFYIASYSYKVYWDSGEVFIKKDNELFNDTNLNENIILQNLKFVDYTSDKQHLVDKWMNIPKDTCIEVIIDNVRTLAYFIQLDIETKRFYVKFFECNNSKIYPITKCRLLSDDTFDDVTILKS